MESPQGLSRAILAPRDLILDTPEAQRLALFFDFILTWPLDSQDLKKEEFTRLQTELEYLAAEKIVVRCGIKMPSLFSFGSKDGDSWDPFSSLSENCDLVLPPKVILDIPKNQNTDTHTDRIVRHVSSLLQYAGAPVTAYLPSINLPITNAEMRAVEMTVKKVPIPPGNLPWNDLIQFRKEDETKSLLRKLRLWLQHQVQSENPPHQIEEELESLLDDYRKYMKLQHRKFGEGVFSTVLVATTDAITNLLNLKAGDVLKSLLDIRGRKIELSQAELSAPGREVSYIAKAQAFVENNRHIGN